MKTTMEASEKARLLKSRNSTNGWSWRNSAMTKPAPEMKAMPNSVRMYCEPQPSTFPWLTASSSDTRNAARVSMPGRSSGRPLCRGAVGRMRYARMSPRMPTGTLM